MKIIGGKTTYDHSIAEEGMINTLEGYVYCFNSNGYVGVKSDLQIYIPAAFDAVEIVPSKDKRWPFFAVVKMNGKYGIVSHKNEMLLDCTYDEIKWHKNSSTFQICLKGQYYAVNYICNIGLVRTDNYGFISKFTKFTEYPSFMTELMKYGLDNRQYAIVEKDGKYGIILDDGSLWVEPIFDKIKFFCAYNNSLLKGLYAEVTSKDGYTSYIDYRGFFYGIIPSYDYNMALAVFYENRYIVRNKENKWGIIDCQNNIISNFQYTGYVRYQRMKYASVEIFIDNAGYVLVSLDDGKQLTPHYEKIHWSNSPYCIVENESKRGIYNTKGQCLVPCEYDYIGSPYGDIFVIYNGIKGHLENGVFVPYIQKEESTSTSITVRKERPTYNNYHGSYAQDEAGYSDDEIDTIFDGDPDAYWNID